MTARITRGAEAPEYIPRLHTGVTARRLQGMDAGPTDRFWVGSSAYPPGSSADLSPTSEETVYVVEEGRLRLTVDGSESFLEAGDSVHMPKGTVRQLENLSDDDARIIVIVAIPA